MNLGCHQAKYWLKWVIAKITESGYKGEIWTGPAICDPSAFVTQLIGL
jgi:hypothetical protein